MPAQPTRATTVRRFLMWTGGVTISAVLLIGCTSGNGATPQTTMPGGTDSPTAAPAQVRPAPQETPQDSGLPSANRTSNESKLSPVYWLGTMGQNVYLYREFRERSDDGEPVAQAIRRMTNDTPLDADYFTPWKPASKVTASVSADGVITVDISSDAFGASLDAGMAKRAIQELVYTATAAAAMNSKISSNQAVRVVILVDGQAGYKAFGHVELGKEMTRDASLVAPIWIVDPQDGTTFPRSPVVISGVSTAFTTALGWTVERIEPSRSPGGSSSQPAGRGSAGSGSASRGSDGSGSDGSGSSSAAPSRRAPSSGSVAEPTSSASGSLAPSPVASSEQGPWRMKGSVPLDGSGRFSFSVSMDPGTYLVRVFHPVDDSADAEQSGSSPSASSNEIVEDTKVITVG